MRFPCPHTRELTDDELNRIAAEGLKDWQQQNKKKEPLEGDEWKEQ
jgi:hypothetical protein